MKLTTVYQTSVTFRILVLLSLYLLCGAYFVFAQSETLDNTNNVSTTENSATSTSASSTPETSGIPPVSPYETEPLLGDEVYGDFVVGPGKVELAIKPGESKTIMITVSNRTGVPKVFDLMAEDAKGSSNPNETLVLLGDDRGPYSLKDYVSVPASQFTLGHNQRARVPVTVTIPADAEPGGLYGSLLVSTVTKEATDGGIDGTAPKSAVIARIGTLFFITIPGQVTKDGSLRDFGTAPLKKVYQEGPLNFGLLFENRSNVHLAPYGEIRIHNFFNEEVGYMELEPWFVLPQSLRLREVTWNRDVLFGRYTATAYINRSYDDVIDERSFVFWVLPWKPLLGIFGALFLLFFLIRTFFKRFEFKRKS